jgi:hypothetical protein
MLCWGDHPGNYPLLHDVAFFAGREPFGAMIWEWACRNLVEPMKESLRDRLADPEWQLEPRKEVWTEIGEQPPGGVDGAIDPRNVDPAKANPNVN